MSLGGESKFFFWLVYLKLVSEAVCVEHGCLLWASPLLNGLEQATSLSGPQLSLL